MQTSDHKGLGREDAVAYGFFMAIAAIILAGVVLAMFGPVNNKVLDYSNDEIDAGHMSVQTKHAIGWNVAAMVWAPIICLVVFFLWSVIRALEQKRAGS